MVDLGERQLLAQLVALPAVAGEVDRLRLQERFVQLVQLLLDRTHPPLLFRRPFVRFDTPLLPRVEDAVLSQAHVTGRRLQKDQLLDKRTFERRLAHVDRAALALAVVVAIAALRPAARQRTATGFAAAETTQRKVGVIPLPRTGDNDAAVEHALRTVERRIIDNRPEVALY
jgi:hypothetical protein